eukprot:16819-Heterococcus_DN1.PRE.1
MQSTACMKDDQAKSISQTAQYTVIAAARRYSLQALATAAHTGPEVCNVSKWIISTHYYSVYTAVSCVRYKHTHQ